MTDSVIVTDEGAVRIIRFNRPEKKNALTQPMYAAITGALHEAQASAAIRAVILTGGQGVFSAGADIGEFLEFGAKWRSSAAHSGISQGARSQ